MFRTSSDTVFGEALLPQILLRKTSQTPKTLSGNAARHTAPGA